MGFALFSNPPSVSCLELSLLFSEKFVARFYMVFHFVPMERAGEHTVGEG